MLKNLNIESRKGALGYVGIIIVGLILAFAVHHKAAADLETALKHYKENSQKEADEAAKSLSYSLGLVYQGIRTISQLPSIKTLDRDAKNLDANARESIIQIYNNLATNVAISEVYVVQADLEPEKIDPRTGGLGQPVLMFDDHATATPEKSDEEEPPITTIEQALQVEEVEIHEYRVLKEQLAYLKAHYGNSSLIDGLNLPLLGGPAVLTCDNSEFSDTKNDADRTGVVLSVPFYSPDGVLKGAITAVIRDNVIKDMMPETNYSLLNETYNYRIDAKDPGQVLASSAWVDKYTSAPDLLFSTTVEVPTSDPRSKWLLWAGYPDEKFTSSGDARAAREFGYFGYSFAGLLTLLGLVVWAMLQRSFAQMRENNIKLEEKVNERTKEVEDMLMAQESQKAEAEKQKRSIMQRMADSFEKTVKGAVAEVASYAARMQTGAENMATIAADTKQRSIVVANVAHSAAEASSQVAAAAEELTATTKEISSQTHLSSTIAAEAAGKAAAARDIIQSLADKSQKVTEIIEVITNIAGQINLLSLNATIEAARAGDAGRGFAVVASEVKNLSNQVSKATGDITKQIGDMQEATKISVESVMDIVNIISGVSSSTTNVVAAVAEQSTATTEIAQNIAAAAKGTQEIAENISPVKEAAQKTGEMAGEVLQSARALNAQSSLLTQKVDEFLQTVRTA